MNGLRTNLDFWQGVDRSDPNACWNWTRALSNGYGRVSIPPHNRQMRAHRVAWSLRYGDPGERCVLHHCDNPRCVNPAHLFLGTILDNNRDKAAKGRHHNQKSHCKRGHEFTPENTWLDKKGRRFCYVCNRLRASIQRAKARAEMTPERRERNRAYQRAWYHKNKNKETT